MTAPTFVALLVDQHGPGAVTFPWTPDREAARARLLQARHAEAHGLSARWLDITDEARHEWHRREREGWS